MPPTIELASPCAAPSSSVNELATAQLFAAAENALSVALYHLRQPSANVPGASRKAVQALAALNRLRALAVDQPGAVSVNNVEGV